MMNEGHAPDSIAAVIMSIVGLIRKNLVFLLVVGLISSVGSVLWVLSLPNVYSSSSTVLPAESNAGTFNLISQIAGMGGLSGSGSAESYLQLYPIIAKSRRVLTPLMDVEFHGRPTWEMIVDKTNLETNEQAYFKEMALLATQGGLVGTADLRQGLFQLRFTHEDKEFSSFVVNSVIERMDEFFRLNLRNEAGKKISKIKTRLDSVSITLDAGEILLQNFRLNNREHKFSPPLVMQEGRLMREVEIQSTLFIELSRQLELAKISDSEGSSVLKVLDRAVPPLKKSGPRRALMVVSIVMVFELLGMLFCWYRK